MAKKSPIATIKDAATGAIEAPVVLAGKAVGQVSKAAGAVTSLVPGRKSKPAGVPEVDRGGPVATPATTQRKVAGDPLKPTAPAAKKAPAKKAPAKKATATKAPAKKAPTKKVTTTTPKPPAKDAPAAKPAAKDAPAAKPAAKDAPAAKPAAKDAPGAKLPAKKAPAKKAATAKKAAAPKPVNVVEKLDLDPAPVDAPSSTGTVTSIDAKAKDTPVSATPADIAAAVQKPTDS